MRTGLPRLIVKIATSLDGRIALATVPVNGSQVNLRERKFIGCVRNSAVLTGIDTVLADDPQLTVRDPAIDMRAASRCESCSIRSFACRRPRACCGAG